MSYIIGTRGSGLALWQAHAVEAAILDAKPGSDVEVRIISTKGDRVLDKPLEQIGDKGLFTKELEAALIDGEVDLCVHSMKDVPAELPDGCMIGAMLPRADVRDVLACGPRISASSLDEVPAGSRIGTGSLRRTAQLRALFPNIEPTPIRGNVDTRLAKGAGDDYEGVMLAAAGITRMGWADRISCYVPADVLVPAVGQGAVGIEIRSDDERVRDLCAAIDDPATSKCVHVERRILAALEGGCQVPMGAYARMEGDRLIVDAVVLSVDGSRVARARFEGDQTACEEAADSIVSQLVEGGAREILEEIRKAG